MLLCGEIFPCSNLAIAENCWRISAYLSRAFWCTNEGLHRTNRALQQSLDARFESTAMARPGTMRELWQDLHFSRQSTKRQRETHVNCDVFGTCQYRVPHPSNHRCFGISTSSLRPHRDFIYEQCRRFGGERERTLIDKTDLSAPNLD